MKKFYLASSAFVALLPLAFMSDAVRTVTVKGVRMNLSEYDEKLHGPVDDGSDAEKGDCPLETLQREQEDKAREMRLSDQRFEDAKNKQIATDPTKQMSTGNVDSRTPEQIEMFNRISKINFGVVADGRKHFVVDTNDVDENGAAKRVVNLPGIDENGYASLKKGWDAVVAVQSQITSTSPATGTTVDPKAGEGASGDDSGAGGGSGGDGAGGSE